MAVLEEIIRAADLYKYVGLKRTQVNELVAAGELPPPILLSAGGRAKGWLKSDVQAWQARRIAESRGYHVHIGEDGVRLIILKEIEGEDINAYYERIGRIADELDQ